MIWTLYSEYTEVAEYTVMLMVNLTLSYTLNSAFETILFEWS